MTMRDEFEAWWRADRERFGREVDFSRDAGDMYRDVEVFLLFEAYSEGRRAERDRVEALQAEESPFHQVLCTGEGCKECERCERVAAAVLKRKGEP